MPKPNEAWSPVMTTTTTEAGQAIKCLPFTDPDTGAEIMLPAVLDADGVEVPFNPMRNQSKLALINKESRIRREHLEAMAKTLGIEGGERNEIYRKVVERVSEMPQLLRDLEDARAAGPSDDDVAARAQSLAQTQVDRQKRIAEELRGDLQKKENLLAETQRKLTDHQVNDGLRQFHASNPEMFAEGSLPLFLSAMRQQHGDWQVRPTGKLDPATSVPILGFYDETGEQRMDTASNTPYTLKQFITEGSFMKTNSPLFRQKGGSGGEEAGGLDPESMTREQYEAALSAELDAI